MISPPIKPENILIDFARLENVLFCDNQENEYAEINLNGHTEIYRADSVKYKGWLRKKYYYQTLTGVSKAALDTAIDTIKSIADFDGDRKDVYLRVAQVDNSMYIDLCNESWQVVEVDINYFCFETAFWWSLQFVFYGMTNQHHVFRSDLARTDIEL